MTADQIRDISDRGLDDNAFWLKQIAYQLALINQREAVRSSESGSLRALLTEALRVLDAQQFGDGQGTV